MAKQTGCVLNPNHAGECYVGTKTYDCGDAQQSAEIAKLRANLARMDRALADERAAVAIAHERMDALTAERDARVPLASLPTEFVAGEWIMSGEAEPDAVVTYARVPSPETGHVGWCWWARGKMGDARDYVAAREAAEKALRAHAAGSGNGARMRKPLTRELIVDELIVAVYDQSQTHDRDDENVIRRFLAEIDRESWIELAIADYRAACCIVEENGADESSEPSPPPTAPPLLEWGPDGPRLSEYERKRLEREAEYALDGVCDECGGYLYVGEYGSLEMCPACNGTGRKEGRDD